MRNPSRSQIDFNKAFEIVNVIRIWNPQLDGTDFEPGNYITGINDFYFFMQSYFHTNIFLPFFADLQSDFIIIALFPNYKYQTLPLYSIAFTPFATLTMKSCTLVTMLIALSEPRSRSLLTTNSEISTV